MKQWVTAVLMPVFLLFISCTPPLLEDDQHEEIKQTITEHIDEHFPFLPGRGGAMEDSGVTLTQLFNEDHDQSNEDFIQYLTREVASLKDGHTSVRLKDPETGNSVYLYGAYPGIRIRTIDDTFYIQHISPHYSDAGLETGDRITGINLQRNDKTVYDSPLDPKDLADAASQFIPASSDGARSQFAANSLIAQAVRGVEYDQIVFSIDGNGVITVDKPTAEDRFPRRSTPFSRELNEHIFYIAIPTMGYLDDIDTLDAMIDKGMGYDGMILDLRGNGGGSSAVGDYLIARFNLNSEFHFTIRDGISGEITHSIGPVKPRGTQYSGEVALLVDHYVFSAANHLVALCAYANTINAREKPFRIIGTHTGGGCGIPEIFDITEAISLRLSTRIITDPDGKHTERGIPPEEEILITSGQLGAGMRIHAPDDAEDLDIDHDLILHKAVDILSGGSQ
jgi:C-terminal processing protease CtpA/Prc